MYTYCRSIHSNCPYVHSIVSINTLKLSICTLNVFDQYTQLSICTLNVDQYTQIVHMYTNCRSIQQMCSICTLNVINTTNWPYVYLLSTNTTNCSICTLNVDQYKQNCPYVHLLSINTTNCPYVY